MRITNGTLPLVMGAYAKNFGLELYMCGRYAYTDGKTIVIPAMDLNDPVSMEMAYGYVAHECGHVKYTDWDFFNNVVTKQNGFIREFFNALEDCRVEYYHVRDWPGMTKTFNFLINQLAPDISNFITKLVKHKDFDTLIIFYAMYHVRFKQNGQDSAKPIANRIRRFLKRYLPSSFIKLIEQELIAVAKLKTSEEIYEVVMRLTQILKELTQYVKNKLSSSFAEQSISDVRTKVTKELTTNFNMPSEEVFGVLDELESCDIKQMEGFFANIAFNECEEFPTIAKKLSAVSKSMRGNSFDFGAVRVERAKPMTSNPYLKNICLNSNFRNRIANLINTIKYEDAFHAECGKHLDVRKFALRKFSDNNRLFYRRVLKHDYRTHIQLLVDNSGSMRSACQKIDKPRYKVANEVAYVLANAMANFSKVKCDVTYFPGEKTEVNIVCTYKESPKAKAAFFEQRPRGSTPLAQALMYSIMNCNFRNMYERNIILVVTDGEPDDIKAARSMIKRAKECNIEVYGIYIASKGVSTDLFDYTRNIETLDEIYDAVCDLLYTAMRNRALGKPPLIDGATGNDFYNAVEALCA